MLSIEKEIEKFCEFYELFHCPMGIVGMNDVSNSSDIRKYTSVCEELRDTGRIDISGCHLMDLFHFTTSMLQQIKAFELHPCLGWGNLTEDGELTGLTELLYIGLGYAVLYEDEAQVSVIDSPRALAAIARMKYSSFRTSISASGLRQYEDQVEFVKNRRSFIPLEVYDSTAITDNYKLLYHEQSKKSLVAALIRRAEYRKITREYLKKVFKVKDDAMFVEVLVKPENCTTLAELLSLDLNALIKVLKLIDMKEEQSRIEKQYECVTNIPFKVQIMDTKVDEDAVTPNDFINMLKSIGNIHPNYKSSKKMTVILLKNDIEVGVETSTTKTVNIWVNSRYIDGQLEELVKAKYEKTSEEATVYGRHSALRRYNQLAWKAVSKLVIRTVGEARIIITRLGLAKA